MGDFCLTIDGQFFCFVQSLDRHGLIRIRSQRFVKFKQFRPASGYRGIALKKDRLIIGRLNPPYAGQIHCFRLTRAETRMERKR